MVHARGPLEGQMKRKELQQLSDDDLFARFITGDPEAANILLARYRPGLYRFFARKVPAVDAEDLTQKLLKVLMLAPERGEGNEVKSFRSFAFGAARMMLLNYCSRRAKGAHFDPASQSLMALDPSLSRQLSERNRLMWLNSAIETLPIETQILLDLRYGEHLTYREVAVIYGVPEPTLRRRMQLLKEQLRKMRHEFEKKP